MLIPVRPSSCAPGLIASKELQATLVNWLCAPDRVAADLTDRNVHALHADPIVGDWLVRFLHRTQDGTSIKSSCEVLANLSAEHKDFVIAWLRDSGNVTSQFNAAPPVWPKNPPLKSPAWNSLRTLLIAFYEIGLGEGLPFNPAGQPTRTEGLKRDRFVAAFKSESAEWVCVLCQGPANGLQVDHWIAKAHFPNLSVAPDNLLPICSDCNSSAYKGHKLVLSPGQAQPFLEWFHPYHRPAHDKVLPNYRDGKVRVEPLSVEYAPHVRNLDGLLKLSARWSNYHRMYYGDYQRELADKIRRGRVAGTLDGLREELREYLTQMNIGTRKYHPFLQKLVVESALEPERLEAWLVELTGGEAAAPGEAN